MQPQICWLKLFRHQVVNLRSLLDDRNPRNPTRMSISRPRNMDKYGLIKGLLYNPSSPKKPLLLGENAGKRGRGTLRFPWFRPATSFASTRDSVSKPQRWRKSPSWVWKPKSLRHQGKPQQLLQGGPRMQEKMELQRAPINGQQINGELFLFPPYVIGVKFQPSYNC